MIFWLNLKIIFQRHPVIVKEERNCINRQNLETLHLAPTQFWHLPGFYLISMQSSFVQKIVCYRVTIISTRESQLTKSPLPLS